MFIDMLRPRDKKHDPFDWFNREIERIDGAFNASGRVVTKGTKDTLEISVDVPGATKETLQAELGDGWLKVSYRHPSRGDQSFSTSFSGTTLGEPILIETAKASLVDGVLTITVGRKARADSVKLTIS